MLVPMMIVVGGTSSAEVDMICVHRFLWSMIFMRACSMERGEKKTAKK